MKKLRTLLKAIDAISEWAGKTFAYLILLGIIILVWEVVSRYVFNHPTMWAHGISQRLFAVYYIISGAYVLRYNRHVSVDLFFNRFSLRGKAILSLFGNIFFFVFCGVLFWTGLDFAWSSLQQLEPDETPWRAPIYPVKIMLALGALLILLQGLAKLCRDLVTAFTGEDLL